MITLQRNKPQKDRTTGFITLPDGTQIKTLERPWLDNLPSISCIPAGIYKFQRDRHGRHQWWKILDVEGRTAIEIHEGSRPQHSEGCILMSKGALLLMDDFFSKDNLTYILEIRGYTASQGGIY